MIDDKLLEYATDREKEFVKAVQECGSNKKAAAKMGVARRTIDRGIVRLKTRAARQGYSPEHDMIRPVPDGFHLKGTSTLYDSEGNQKIQWVKSNIDRERQAELMREAARTISSEIPRLKPIPPPYKTLSKLCNLYTLTDCHIGEYATASQGGGNWNLEIAEKTLTECFGVMIDGAPKAKHCVVNQLGDFLTFDGLEPVTPTNRHPLNTAGLYAELIDVSIRVLRRIIDMALSKHEHVHLILAEGNHDLAGSLWLRKMFRALYEMEPRITVNMSETPYYAYRHGKTMLAFHHGHKAQNAALPGIFASMFPEIWGATTFREGHTGHYHKEEVGTFPGMIVRRHPTLTATGTYASRLGHVSNRRAQGITYHAEYGRVGINEVVPEMLSAA